VNILLVHRVGNLTGLEKTRVFLKNPAQWVFLVFFGFSLGFLGFFGIFGFFWDFLGFLPRREGF
jgi:hypothetical protein